MEYTDCAEEKVQITELLMVTLIIVSQFPTVSSRREGKRKFMKLILFHFCNKKYLSDKLKGLFSSSIHYGLGIKRKLDNVSSNNLCDPKSQLREVSTVNET